jgi:asparagine synthase (glutamine-hydrolysing)
MASETRVVLTGDGSDPLFCLSPLTSWASARAIPFGDFAINIARYVWDQRAVPKFRLRSTLWTLLGRVAQERPEIPAWLDRGFSQRCKIGDRVDACMRRTPAGNGLRPLARFSLSNGFWPAFFEGQDAAWLWTGIEIRNPYFDLRLVRWLLAIPELPYSMDKWLLRMALRGMLPEAVRTRPKTPLRGDPTFAAFQRHGIGAPQPLRLHARMHEFVNPAVVPVLGKDSPADRLRVDSRPISLNNWLTSQEEKDICGKKLLDPFALPTLRPSCAFMAM